MCFKPIRIARPSGVHLKHPLFTTDQPPLLGGEQDAGGRHWSHALGLPGRNHLPKIAAERIGGAGGTLAECGADLPPAVA
jgi:hypothetical protein